MDISLTQGILLTVAVFILAWDARWETFFAFRPIVMSFVAGIILNNVTLGLKAGAIAELSYLGLTTVGGTVPPNPLMAGLMTVVLAYKSGIAPEAALGLSLPFALLMQWITIACQSAFAGFNAKLEEAASENNTKKFTFYVFLPELILTSLYAIVAFLSVYALQDQIRAFVESFPVFISHGFEIAGGLLPAVGLGLLLKVMVKKENVPYLVLGFLMMSILPLDNVLPVALTAAALAGIGYMRDQETVKEGDMDDESGI